jgi:hypothetical protein
MTLSNTSLQRANRLQFVGLWLRLARAGLSLWVLGLLLGCATYQESANAWLNKLKNGQHQQALQDIETQSKDSNKVLDAMNKGMVYRMKKDWDKSNAEFGTALRTADQMRALSVSETLGSTLLAESFRSYEGAQFELLSLPIFSAYNYIDKNDCSAARVEARRINELIKENNEPKKILPWAVFFSGLVYEMLGEYDNARVSYRQADGLYRKISSRQSRYASADTGTPAVLQTSMAIVKNRPDSKNRGCRDFGLKESVTTTMPTESTSNSTVADSSPAPNTVAKSARPVRLSPAQQRQQEAEAKRLALQTAQANAMAAKAQADAAANAAQNAPTVQLSPERSELLVIYHHGLVSQMQSNHLTINAEQPLGIIKIALPSYGPAPSLPSAMVTVSGSAGGSSSSENFQLSVVANYESLARAELADNLPGMQARVVSRLLARKVASAATQKSGNDNAKLLGSLLELSQLVTENADTRAWPLAPSAVYVGRKELPAGKKRIKVNAGGYGVELDLDLEPGKTVLLNVHKAFPNVAAAATSTAQK